MGLFTKNPPNVLNLTNFLGLTFTHRNHEISHVYKYVRSLKTFQEQDSYLRGQMDNAIYYKNKHAGNIIVDAAHHLSIMIHTDETCKLFRYLVRELGLNPNLQ